MIVTVVYTMANNKKQRTTNFEKQSQTNPIKANSEPKQSQNKPNQTQLYPPLRLAGLSASTGSVVSLCFLAITICCVLPKLPKLTSVIGY
jgi:hypothetical protein